MNAILVTEDWPSDRDKESGVTVQDLTQVRSSRFEVRSLL